MRKSSKKGLFFVLSVLLVLTGITVQGKIGSRQMFVQAVLGGTLDPTSITKYVTPLVKPPAMPPHVSNKNKDSYKIAVRQFQQQILPAVNGIPPTTVWSYGSIKHPGTAYEGGTFHYPAFTIEATYNKEVQVQWRNELVDEMGNYLPHLLPVDQSLHWANPPGGLAGRDTRPTNPPQTPYTGPVPMIVHVHGAHVSEDSDGYTEAWYLPDANDIPAGYATTGTFYDYYNATYNENWSPGTATFKYPNDQRAATLWYHDHTLGMTRLNVYAGPAGFYLVRGGPDDVVKIQGTNTPAVLPGPAPGVGDSPFGTYYEIPIVVQDRSFNADGSLFYPDNRAFFEEGRNVPPTVPFLDIPFIPDPACDGQLSDISPIWNPEFFGNVMVVNGYSWPNLQVEPRRYRFRFLNGCNSRFLMLVGTTQDPATLGPTVRASQDLTFWRIGTEGGFLPAPVQQTELLMGLAERADVIVDFSGFTPGDIIYLTNEGPDEPFGGGEPGVDFDIADAATTRQVMRFEVVAGTGTDTTTPPGMLDLPNLPVLGPESVTRQLSLNEEDSSTVRVSEDGSGNIVLDCADGELFGPREALLGTVGAGGASTPLLWVDPITENPAVGATEVWEIYNYTADAHPMHLHLVMFQVVDRQPLMTDEDGEVVFPVSFAGAPRPPETWETGYKDTVIAYPGEVTRIRAMFDLPGLYVWHCHIVEHEDNEMMRPFHVGPIPF